MIFAGLLQRAVTDLASEIAGRTRDLLAGGGDRKLGRPKRAYDHSKVDRARRLRAAGRSVREIAVLLSVSPTTAQRILKAPR